MDGRDAAEYRAKVTKMTHRPDLMPKRVVVHDAIHAGLACLEDGACEDVMLRRLDHLAADMARALPRIALFRH